MRIRAAVATALLLLPVALEAQRFPRPGITGRGPTGPQPLPPQPAPIARLMAFKRLRMSVESYPFLTYTQTPPVGDNPLLKRSRMSGGAGTRADYRLSRHFSATLDVTTTLFGGMTTTQTVELGTRWRPERSERRAYPYVDLRAGLVSAFDGAIRPFDIVDGAADPVASGGRYSRGYGAVAGAGMEYALTRRFSLMTGASVLRSGMTAYRAYGPVPPSPHYALTAYRLTLGLKYNPVRMMNATNRATP